MKLFAAIIAFATASTAVSNDTKVGCLCCLDLQVICCTACLWPYSDSQAEVAQSLTTIRVISLKTGS